MAFKSFSVVLFIMTAISIDKFQTSLEDGQEFAISEALKVYDFLNKNSAWAMTATEIVKETNQNI